MSRLLTFTGEKIINIQEQTNTTFEKSNLVEDLPVYTVIGCVTLATIGVIYAKHRKNNAPYNDDTSEVN